MRLPSTRHIISASFALFWTLSFLIPMNTNGQDYGAGKGKYQWFDDILGDTNSGIFKGILYVNEYRVVNDRHQFFESEDFKSGSVVYYGQEYFGVFLKYDVYLDNLIGVNYELANEPAMVFDKNGVAKFSIGNNNFEKVSNEAISEEAGFFEVLLRDKSLTLYKKHGKKLFKRTDEQLIYYEFKDNFSYFLEMNSTFRSFKKAKELQRIFPEHKKRIKESLQLRSSLRKSSHDDYVKKVLLDIIKPDANQENKRP